MLRRNDLGRRSFPPGFSVCLSFGQWGGVSVHWLPDLAQFRVCLGFASLILCCYDMDAAVCGLIGRMLDAEEESTRLRALLEVDPC